MRYEITEKEKEEKEEEEEALQTARCGESSRLFLLGQPPL
jgi:hypothetical protein